MKRRVLLAFIVMAACAAVGFRQADQSTPEATVKAFAAAIQAGDFKAAALMVKGGKADFDYADLLKDFKKASFKIEVIDLKADVQGDQASASFKVSFTSGTSASQAMGPETLKLERARGSWLIVPAATMDVRGPFGQFAKMLTDPTGAMVRAHSAAEAAVCLSNVKQLCMGFLMLANDYDDVFKFRADGWKKAIMPYVKNEGIFHCPEDKSGNVSYSVNPYVVGKSTTRIDLASETVLVYEGRKMKLDFRHNGRACVGFVDGHVQMVAEARAKALRWKPKFGIVPPPVGGGKPERGSKRG